MMETAHNTRKGLWDGPPFPDRIIVSSNMYLEGKLNPYRSPLCPEHRCVKCDENRAYINEREARPKKNEVGRHADMCSRVVFTEVRPAHTNPWKPDPRKRRWVSILVSRREVVQEGRKVVIETPVFPGYTPGVAPRTIYEDEQARTKYRTRAKQTAALKGTAGAIPSCPECTREASAGLHERWQGRATRNCCPAPIEATQEVPEQEEEEEGRTGHTRPRRPLTCSHMITNSPSGPLILFCPSVCDLASLLSACATYSQTCIVSPPPSL